MARTTHRSTRRGRGQLAPQRRTGWTVALVVGVLALLGLGGWYASAALRETREDAHPHAANAAAVDHRHGQGDVELPHLHGMGFTADGRQLFVAAHDGLRVFADGEWLVPTLPVNDYMGYTPTDNGFYSSGHPGPSSDLVNPLGLVKSSDGGKTLSTLGFAGESDFHLMGVGYTTHAIYLLNPTPNSKLQTGLYSSLDDGATWKQSAARGVTGQPIQIAVHPTDSKVVALATDAGLFLSSNYGDTFERVGDAQAMTAAAFDPRGEKLYFGANALQVYDLKGKQVSTLPTPTIAASNAIQYIAVNPAQPHQTIMATFERDMYVSNDGGQTWQQIADDGIGT